MSRRILAALAPAVLAPLAGARHECQHGETHQHPVGALWEQLAPSAGSAAGGAPVLVTPEYFSHVCVVGTLEPPAGWVSANSHTHHEECGQLFPHERLYFDSSCLAQQFMAPRDIQISTPLLWGTQNLGNAPWVLPGMILAGGDCIQAGQPNPIFRREWEGYVGPGGQPVPGQSEALTGLAESHLLDYLPYGVPARERILQDGIEVSGWSASEWGHYAALNVTQPLGGDLFANYEALSGRTGCAPLFDGDDVASPSLAQKYPFRQVVQHYECGVPGPPPVVTGHKNDGTGDWSLPVFEIFERDPAAITGYMHQLWPIDTVVDDTHYGPGVGWDWFAHLGSAYAADEIHCFPTDMRAAFPDNFETGNTAWPLLAALDAALGYVDYLEAYDLELRDWNPDSAPVTYPCAGGPVVACGEEDHHTTPRDAWYGMYYKLLSAGVRTSIAAGSDGTCDTGCAPQTYVDVGNTAGLSPSEVYDRFTERLAAGRVSLATEGYHFLNMRVDDRTIGGRVELDERGSVEVRITYALAPEVLDPQGPSYFFDPQSAVFTAEDRVLELVHDGAVVATHVLTPGDFVSGLARMTVPALPVLDSGWLAARTRSTSAHTAATTVIVDEEPVASCFEAEYWMIYCDYVRYKIDAYSACRAQTDWLGNPVDVPEVTEQHVGCSQSDIERHVADARRVFQAHRDFGRGDPAGVCRHGEKQSPSCGEPLALVVGGDLASTPGVELRLGCINAPADTVGLLVLGIDAGGNAIVPGPLPPYFAPNAQVLVVTTGHGGFSGIEHTFPNGFPAAGTLYAQYLWINPPGCDEAGPVSWTRAVSITLDPASLYAACP